MKNKKVPQLRFRGFEDEWEEKKLGEVSDRVTRTNENLDSKLPLTISAQYGLVDQITFFNNQVASVTNLKNYLLLEKGEFAYNKSYSAGYPWGAIKRLDRYEKGVLSTLYIVFKPKKINSDYLVAYYDTTNWHKQVSEIAAEGARNHGLLNIAPNDFFQITFLAPKSGKEQRKIGSFLSKIDSLIQAKTQKLESLKAVKKSLLQKCFPKDGEKVPEIRFAGFSGDWEENKLGDFGEVCMCKRIFKEQTSLTESIPFYKIGTFGSEADAYISRDLFEYYKTHYPYPKTGTILISASGSIGRTVVYEGKEEYFQDSNIVWLEHNEKISDSFLKIFYDFVEWNGIEGTTIKRLYNSIILKQKIMVPSIDEQQKIGQFFSKYDSLIILQQKEIDNLKTIKKSLLQKMFV